ncbi:MULTISPECIES: helix-turn-helix domain-containing protein [Streptomycetaceae]|uniref:helix-turn-helix domain-containing protein n=1 Tax=Streptomycetaceae TaxID=2062 RepID=UPI002E76FF7B|nr:helix-turn-helix domain-containing protein [Streptomyces sp. BE303]MED7950374.1 helix-turn-helix domain-containing protein [Streptomyces sp. BE303]
MYARPRVPAVSRLSVPTPAATDPAHQADPASEFDLLHSGWYSTEELAALLKVDPSTLRRWRSATPPQGPPFVQIAPRLYLYSIPDTQLWLAQKRTDPSEAA